MHTWSSTRREREKKLYLCLCVRPGRRYDAYRQEHHSSDLNARVFLAVKAASYYGSDAAARTQDNMNRYRNIITKGVVVEQVNTEEKHNVDQPTPNRHPVRSYEERGPSSIELRDISRDCDEEKLHKSQERPCEPCSECLFKGDEAQDEASAMDIVPLAGSTLWNGQEH